jgi:TIR domain
MITAFISHSTKDRAFVEQEMIPFLESLGITPWYSRDDIKVAAAWERSIREALVRSDWVMVILSPTAVQSDWVRSEVHWALENRVGRVMPVRLEPCDPSELHIKLAGIQYADWGSDPTAARLRLAALFGCTSSPIAENGVQDTAGYQITKSLRTHFADIVNRGAYVRRREVEWPDLWRIGVLFLSGGVSLSETISKLANDLFGLPGSAVPLLVALTGLAWAWFVVGAKNAISQQPRIEVPQHDVAAPRIIYTYDETVRWIAKFGLLLFAILFIRQLSTFVDDLVPLPTTIHGYLIDGRTGAPLEGASVRVFEKSGVDITTKQLASDSTGFYVVHTLRGFRRNATVVVSPPKCGSESRLPLYRIYETSLDVHGDKLPEYLRPVFRHTVRCGEEK